MANAKLLPSRADLNSILEYDAETGRLFWRPRSFDLFPDVRSGKIWNSRYAGKEAFTTSDQNGYRRGRVFDVPYLAHRLIWMMIAGENPDIIDHIDGNPANNRFENLRSVGAVQNARNQKMHSRNTSGVVGVCTAPPSVRSAKKWEARIGKGLIGRFHCIGQAIKARKEAERRHGFHKNHGRAA